jgi:hypothetical protein
MRHKNITSLAELVLARCKKMSKNTPHMAWTEGVFRVEGLRRPVEIKVTYNPVHGYDDKIHAAACAVERAQLSVAKAANQLVRSALGYNDISYRWARRSIERAIEQLTEANRALSGKIEEQANVGMDIL